jgi:hypothetical protein
MAKYEVIRPWHGVALGDVVEMEKLHPALKPNVRVIKGKAALDPATPTESRKDVITGRLKELEIDFDARKGEKALAELLPEGEMEKLFPAE